MYKKPQMMSMAQDQMVALTNAQAKCKIGYIGCGSGYKMCIFGYK